MSRVKWSISLFSAVLFVLAGCGYSFGNLLLDGNRTLTLGKITNETIYACEFIAEESLQSSFSKKGIRIISDNSADLSVLSMNISQASKKASIYDDENKPLQYRISVEVEYKLEKDEDTLKEGVVRDHGYYYPEKTEDNTEEDAIREAMEKISDKIAENCLDRW